MNKKRENDVFGPTNSRIPYLNGGLFEEEKLKIKTIDFPTEFWESLFAFFAEYNFTIDENDPFEQEVGIDPEMLGHIFENLLEDNKDKGAFYTPKPIVEYMCKESLIQYLKTHLFPQNSPLSEGWQTKSDGVLNSPLSEGWQTKSDGVLNSPEQNDGSDSKEFGIFQNYKQLPFNPQLKERARELRQAGNLAEVLFWKQVRNGNFLSLDFHRQKIIGNYIVDFYCPALQLVVEIDGSSHNDKIEYDKEREDSLKALELNIIHFSDLDVKQNLNSVMERLKEYCEKLVNTQNSPLLEGYGFSRGVLDSPLNDRNENTPPDKSSTPLKEGN
ncbi:MAG: DUF559 domain-containing protein, partial [Candidatus Cloacimonadales bacterium]|nr:DUF559 domain-containing protein [Candidatus Cloacimonadales bacterium]